MRDPVCLFKQDLNDHQLQNICLISMIFDSVTTRLLYKSFVLVGV